MAGRGVETAALLFLGWLWRADGPIARVRQLVCLPALEPPNVVGRPFASTIWRRQHDMVNEFFTGDFPDLGLHH